MKVKVPCTLCNYGCEPMEPRMTEYGWRPGLIFSKEARESYPNHPVSSNYYEVCMMCDGSGTTLKDAAEFLKEQGVTVE